MSDAAPMYPWLNAHWCQLIRSINDSQLAHGLLLTGIAGLGKGHLAEQLVRYLHCQAPEQFACGHCRSCRQLQAEQHPDHFELDLVDKARFITVDDVRRLNAWLSQTAHGGRCQTVIIRQADRLNRAAANALLKTLEEPPGESYIILLDHQRSLLPATIVSRLCVIDCHQVDQQLVLDYLSDHDVANPKLLYGLRHGAPLSVIDTDETLACRDKLLQSLQMVKDQSIDVILLTERMLKNDVNLLLDLWSSILLDMLRLQCGFTQDVVTHTDKLSALLHLLQNISLSSLLRQMDAVAKARFYWQGAYHLNQPLLLSRLLLMWQRTGE